MGDLADLKQNLQDDIWDTYEAGIRLEDGCIAFYDQRNDCFVDGSTLKRLHGAAGMMAAEAYDALTPDQQIQNRSYLTCCAIYSDLESGKSGGVALAFNQATQSAPRSGAEHVGNIVQRVFNSLLSPKF